MRIAGRRASPRFLLPVLLILLAGGAAFAENIDPANDGSKYAWAENLGWINLRPSGAGGPGVQVTDSGLTGWAWSENAGWISLSCQNTSSCGAGAYGVTNNGSGTLGGYAWSENKGWINFAPTGAGVVINGCTGVFSGRAWSENAGWITFSSTSPNPYQVATSWRRTCNDNNACTTDTCNPATGCVFTNNVVCTALDQCHDVGTCNTGTGCSNPNKANGTACSDGNACTQTDACQSGACTGTNPVVCTALDQCHAVGTCNTGTGVCSNPNKPNGTACNDGNVCTVGDVCTGGTCAAGGAPAPVAFCNNNAITIRDATTATPYPSSVAVSGLPGVICKVTASLSGITHAFMQDIDVMLSSPTPASNLIVMSDVGPEYPGVSGLNLTLDDVAAASIPEGPVSSGTYKPTNSGPGDPFATPAPTPSTATAFSAFNGSNPNGVWNLWVVDDEGPDTGSMSSWCVNIAAACISDADCSNGGPCRQAGTCNTATGACTYPNKPNGTACNDGNACTQTDACQSGACTGSNPVVCTALDQCHDVGTCNTGTGVCSNPNKANGTACNDGNDCTISDTCGAGTCSGTAITAPPETQSVAVAADKTTYSWAAATYATRYDALRGSLGAFPVGPGGADEVCFDNLSGPTLSDATVPASGTGFWYLSRGENACFNGSFGTQGDHGAPGAPRSTTTCP